MIVMAVSVRMTRDEAWAELARAHTGIFTSLRRDGVPISLPVWFVVLDERIYVGGPATSKKVARVRHDHRVAFLVESGERWRDLRAVHLTGRGRIVEDAESSLLERVSALSDDKYAAFRTPRDDMPDATRQHYAVAHATIEIAPDDRVLSWDNARLFA